MIFLYSHWLRLPIATRHTLAREFKIIKKNPTHVIDDQVRDDGYVIGDIESALTATAMSAYTGLPFTDAEQLWNDVIAKAEGRTVAVEEPVAAIKKVVVAPPLTEVQGLVDLPVKPAKKITKKK